MIDAHIHLDRYPAGKLEAYMDTWREAGIEGVVAVSTDLASAYRTLQLKQRFPGFIFAALGYHPESTLPADAEAAELFDLIRREAEAGTISAIGEVGLPHYSLAGAPSRYEQYRELLDEFVRLGSDLKLPLALHAVHDKAGAALEILRRYPAAKAHFHWLKAPRSIVAEIVHEGYFVSVTPDIVYRERDRELLRRLPLDRLLFETDGPWPFSGPFSGMETTPLLLERTVAFAADFKSMDVNELKRAVMKNTLLLYKREDAAASKPQDD